MRKIFNENKYPLWTHRSVKQGIVIKCQSLPTSLNLLKKWMKIKGAINEKKIVIDGKKSQAADPPPPPQNLGPIVVKFSIILPINPKPIISG